MDTQHPPHGMKAGHKALSRLNLRKQRSNDAHQQLENLAKRDAKDSIRTIFPTTLALARNDATRALQAIQEGGPTVDVLRAICLYVLGDPSWQRLAESIVESGEDPVAREAMCRLLGRE
jgi:Bacterial type III secretion protein (HrpB1_HrpK)